MGKLIRLVFVAYALTALGAPAQKTMDEAKTRFKRGADLYDEGNYRGALIEFGRAYQLMPNYKILYNMGQVHLQLLDYARAQDAFTRYLKEGGTEVSSARKDEVNRELERLRSRVGHIAVNTADGAEVLVDDEAVGNAPLNPISANTGRHKVTVVPPGRSPQSRLIEVAGLETTTVTMGREDAVAAPLPPSGATTSPSVAAVTSTVAPVAAGRSFTPMIVGWVVTGALGITGGVLAGSAFSAGATLAKSKATLGVTAATLNQQASRTSSLSMAADIVGLAAVVAGGISVYLTVASLRPDAVALGLGPGFVTLSAQF